MPRDEAIYRAMMNGIGRVRNQAVPAFMDALAASGYAVVPVEATEEMKKAAEGAIDQLEWSMHFKDGEVNIDMSNLGAFWNAMIDAAQKEGEE